MLAFDESINGAGTLIGVFLVLTTVTTALRFVARIKQKKTIGIDDLAMIPAWSCFVGIFVSAIIGMVNQLVGAPSTTPGAYLMIRPLALRIFFAGNIFSVVIMFCVRLSAVYFYRRIFCAGQSHSSVFSIINNIAIVLICCWFITFLPMTWLVCGPKMGILFGDGDICSPDTRWPYFLSVTSTSFILDVGVMILPLPKIWSLHASFGRKISITAVFLVAAASTATSCARMAINIRLVNQGQAYDKAHANEVNTQSFYYQILEAGLAIFAVNLPSLWYFRPKVTPEHVLGIIRTFITSLLSSTKKTKEATSEDKLGAHQGQVPQG